jgi:hypothetical protein
MSSFRDEWIVEQVAAMERLEWEYGYLQEQILCKRRILTQELQHTLPGLEQHALLGFEIMSAKKRADGETL